MQTVRRQKRERVARRQFRTAVLRCRKGPSGSRQKLRRDSVEQSPLFERSGPLYFRPRPHHGRGIRAITGVTISSRASAWSTRRCAFVRTHCMAAGQWVAWVGCDAAGASHFAKLEGSSRKQKAREGIPPGASILSDSCSDHVSERIRFEPNEMVFGTSAILLSPISISLVGQTAQAFLDVNVNLGSVHLRFRCCELLLVNGAKKPCRRYCGFG